MKHNYGIVILNVGTSQKQLWTILKPLFGLDAIQTKKIVDLKGAILTITSDKEYADAVVKEMNDNEYGIIAKCLIVF